MATLACVVAGCQFAPAEADPAANMRAMMGHIALQHPGQMPAAQINVRPPSLVRPTIDIGCSPSQWATFTKEWGWFVLGSNIQPIQATTQAMACFSRELASAADKAINNIISLDVDELLRQVKTVAVLPVAVGVLRADSGPTLTRYEVSPSIATM